MGAALTYARRYALFTLVGIAGEDDLDAPDLAVSPPAPPTMAPERPKGAGNGTLNGGYHPSAERPASRSTDRAALSPALPALGAEASAELRDRLLGEISRLTSEDDAALWAHRCLPEKNKLTAVDAQLVEAAFRTRLIGLAVGLEDIPQLPTKTEAAPARPAPGSNGPKRRPKPRPVDKSALTLPEPRRVRDRDHVRYVARQPCLICGRQPADAHHLRFAQGRALGRKVSDEFTVPLCRGHHRELHRHGDEAASWTKVGIDPTVPARAQWLETHPLPRSRDEPRKDASGVPAGTTKGSATRDRPVGKRGRNYQTNPIIGMQPR
jgi:hypothetical protein